MLPTTTPLIHDKHTSIYKQFIYYIRILLQEKHSRKLLIYTAVLFIFSLIEVLFGLLYSASLSMLLAGFHSLQQTFGYVIILTTTLVVAKKQPNFEFSYGYERLEVVLNFSNSVFVMFLCFAMITESVQRLLDPHDIKTTLMWLITIVGVMITCTGVYLKKFSLRRNVKMMRFIVDCVTAAISHIGALLAILFSSIHPAVDVFATIVTSCVLAYLTIPKIYEASIVLLQKTPSSMKSSLSKCLREASTVEGVLECHSAHFWPVGYGVGNIVGSLKVRVAKDADEQAVLQAVHKLFAPLLSHLTIQVEKDDWNLRLIPTKARNLSHHHHGHCHRVHGHSHNHFVHHHHHDDHDDHVDTQPSNENIIIEIPKNTIPEQHEEVPLQTIKQQEHTSPTLKQQGNTEIRLRSPASVGDIGKKVLKSEETNSTVSKPPPPPESTEEETMKKHDL